MEITKGGGCPICSNQSALVKSQHPLDTLFSVECEFCGTMFLPQGGLEIEKGILSSFFFYYWVDHQSEKRIFDFTNLTQNWQNSDRIQRPALEDILSWYPRKFSDKVDLVLLALSKLTRFHGQKVIIARERQGSMFFVSKEITETQRAEQIRFFIDFLLSSNYVSTWPIKSDPSAFILMPAGLHRVDELQKDTKNSKTAFVAMSFAPGTEKVRDAIKAGISAIGFEPRLMDEIEHNHQIVPEMLYEIRNSRFVVAELSHHNNGAYYEAGYALGVGKEVIHICKKEEMISSMHFDVKQVNTILWDDEADLGIKLQKRIRATIS